MSVNIWVIKAEKLDLTHATSRSGGRALFTLWGGRYLIMGTSCVYTVDAVLLSDEWRLHV